MDLAAGLGHAAGIVIDVVDADIAQPARSGAGIARLLGQRHQPGDRRLAGEQGGVFHVALAGVLGVPADDLAIKALRGLGIAGHQFVPDELCG